MFASYKAYSAVLNYAPDMRTGLHLYIGTMSSDTKRNAIYLFFLSRKGLVALLGKREKSDKKP